MQGLNKTIYMDNASTTALLPEVLDAMMPYLTTEYGNASNIHSLGYEAKLGINRARKQVADLLQCEPEFIYFTSGATESNNWVFQQPSFTSYLISNIEHDSIENICHYYDKFTNKTVCEICVDEHGIINLKTFNEYLEYYFPDLVSIIYANNEIGVIQDIESMAKICKASGIKFHTDATQALGHIPISLKHSSINYLSASAHKIGGPKGVGLLYCNSSIDPLLYGGHQEQGLRGGTYNVAGIVGYGKACEIARMKLLKNKDGELQNKRRYFISKIKDSIEDVQINTPIDSVPNNANISFLGIDGETLMMLLNDSGIICSTGSACNSGTKEASRILEAINVAPEYIHGTLRFSLGYDISIKDIDYVVSQIKFYVDYLRTH